MENNMPSTEQPVAPIAKKRSAAVFYITIVLGLIVGLVGYFVPLNNHLSSEFCSTRGYGFPLKIQDRLVIDQVTLLNPSNGNPVTTECLHGPSYPNVKSGDIEWVNWIINIVVFVVSFGVAGYLAMRTNKLKWLLLLILFCFLAWMYIVFFQDNTPLVTGY